MHLDKILVDEKQPADLIRGRIIIKYPTLADAAVEFQRLSPCEQKSALMKSAGFTYTRDEIERLCYAKDDFVRSPLAKHLQKLVHTQA
ncbi:hypothetical protein [Afipia felis]|uniref:Uncharacterized protein n=2 Tax=Afipia felis TaxID=1035 RepID=A0A380WC38_AFIFE|nr:hypothetical protein [Afipia felis]EKS29720.1 hypothetical protein HMPREF9697_02248 [Afipia felis ATCC 53690]SUU78427.1 Uncharacterised protein [Afipia felis]SUU86492.1 Uncharacterised protein [Afipia felis]